ncbi:MAG: hypothetical protein OXF41_09140 [bacterium]|nr:hypothetical protein [bacterium]
MADHRAAKSLHPEDTAACDPPTAGARLSRGQGLQPLTYRLSSQMVALLARSGIAGLFKSWVGSPGP